MGRLTVKFEAANFYKSIKYQALYDHPQSRELLCYVWKRWKFSIITLSFCYTLTKRLIWMNNVGFYPFSFELYLQLVISLSFNSFPIAKINRDMFVSRTFLQYRKKMQLLMEWIHLPITQNAADCVNSRTHRFPIFYFAPCRFNVSSKIAVDYEGVRSCSQGIHCLSVESNM